jgi:hypothetical protein
MVLLKLLSLIPIARALTLAIVAVALWIFRDLLVQRRRTAAARSIIRFRRWKLAVLSGLMAAELVLCLVGVTA